MTEKKSGLFVNLVKKAVGMPTSQSSCCGTPAPAQNQTPAPAENTASSSCCGTAAPKDGQTNSGSCCG